MLRQDFNRIDPKRRNVVDHRKKQFADPTYKETEYPHRLNLYATPPTADITLEQFEQWAIDRLRSKLSSQNVSRPVTDGRFASTRRARSMFIS
jgi:hypothetical protein